MTIITIIFAAVLPQFRVILNGWDARQAGTEALQNGRVLIDHISRNLSKAVKITAVSSPSQTNGYIQFIADVNDSNTYRYDIGTDNYVEYGPVGSLSGLAGPVSSLTFTCYDVCDLNTPLSPVTDANVIRTVKVDATIINSNSSSQNKTFTAWAYLRTDANNGGVVGCWKLDETGGIVATDSSGKGNNGTLVNMTLPGCGVAGQIGGAFNFDGTSSYVNLGTNSSLNFGSSAPFTVSAWVKTTDSYGPIVSFRSSTDDNPVIDLAVGYDGGVDSPGYPMILVRQDGSGNYAHVAGGTTVSDGFWHHIAAVRYSNGTVELFLDGVSQGTNSGTGSGGSITTDWRAIGSERRWVSVVYGTADQRYLAGTIDDVRVYNRALSAAEIATLANILTYRGFNEGKAPYDSNITIGIPKPSGTAQNDLLIAALALDENPTSPTASGWSPINFTTYGTAVTLGAWYKIAGASEPASYTFSWSGGQKAYGWIMRFTGYNSANPINVTPVSANQTSATPQSPAVTTTVPNCLILRLGAFDNSDITTDNPGLTTPVLHNAITMDSSGSSDTPTYVAAGTVASSTGAITPALPAGLAVNDILLLILETANQAITIPTPNGGTWTQVTSSPQGTGTAGGTTATCLTVFWSRYNGTQGAPTTSDSGDHQIGMILAFRGVVTSGNPWDVTIGNVASTASTSVSIPGTTTTVANTLVVTIVCNGTDTTTAQTSGWANANLTGLAQRVNNNTNVGNGGGFGVATGVMATAGAYGTTTALLATSSVQGRISIALKPSGAGTVSGGAGYVKQASAGSSGQSNFQLTQSDASQMLTVPIAPAANGSYDCCGDYLQP